MDNTKKRPIGIFDSGIGGITVARELIDIMPNEDIIYFGDTARVPYGTKTKDTIYKFSVQIIRFLKKQNVKMIIIACNTVSSVCYDMLLNEFSDIPIIEVISSGVKSAIDITKNGKIGVIGTQTTINSRKYESKILKSMENAKIYTKACPLFVPLAEEGLFDNEITIKVSKMYLEKMIDNNIDCLILGCTHYPLLKTSIRKVTKNKIQIIDPARETVKKAKKYLYDNNMQNEDGGEYSFFVSDKSDKFSFMCSLLLKKEYIAKKIDIDIY